MSCSEFKIISQYFNCNKFHRDDVKTGIGDDAALVQVPNDKTLVISTDTLVSGIHFLHDIHPTDLGYKSLAVNLSDLAAMGADPAWFTLSITLPHINESWLIDFSKSLFKLSKCYNIQLIGGDTIRGPLSITVGAYGFVPYESALKRSGAQLGDLIYVTGSLGNSAAGLSLLQKKHHINNNKIYKKLIKHHLHPIARIEQGRALRYLATSAIDLSDGFLFSINQICKSSKCGAYINIDKLPILDELRYSFKYEQILHWILNGGEDYELCFSIPEYYSNNLNIALSCFDVPFTCIGKIISESEGVSLYNNNNFIPISYNDTFKHF